MVDVSSAAPVDVHFCLLPAALYMNPSTSVYTDVRRRCTAVVDLVLYMTVLDFLLLVIDFKVYWRNVFLLRYLGDTICSQISRNRINELKFNCSSYI